MREICVCVDVYDDDILICFLFRLGKTREMNKPSNLHDSIVTRKNLFD